MFAVWGILSFRAGALQPVPESLIVIFGICMTGKVVQVFGEKPTAEPPKESESVT